MLRLTRSNWVVVAGLTVAGTGMTFYMLVGTVIHLSSIHEVVATILASMVVIACGLLTAVGGSIVWARRAPIFRVVVAAIATGAAGLLVSQVTTINIHSPTGVPLFFAILFATVDAVLLFLVLAIRWRECRPIRSQPGQ
jgi:hypothetical protein